jgi:S1-C subfamily serine protease
MRPVAVVTSTLMLVLGICPAFAQQGPHATVPLDAASLFRKCSSAVVTIQTPSGFGSGVLIDPAGVVVTNLHVIRGEAKAIVTLANKDAYDDIGVIEVDERKDLVLLKLKGFKLPSVELGDSDKVMVGHSVYAIGAPQGLALSLSSGIVSSVRDSGDGYQVIQTNAAISPGSSGGGLFDEAGHLIGITTFKINGGENLNFAVPINYVRGLLGSTITKMTLANLNERLSGSAAVSNATPTSVASTTPVLAKFYTSTGGSILLVEQSGETVNATYSTGAGVV